MSTDDLLDEATRLADGLSRYYGAGEPEVCRILRALVERVQQAEEAVEVNAGEAAIFHAVAEATRFERDEARGKLDKVRALADEAPDNLLDELRTLLAILDGPARE